MLFEFLNPPFMQRALIAAVLVGITAPAIISGAHCARSAAMQNGALTNSGSLANPARVRASPYASSALDSPTNEAPATAGVSGANGSAASAAGNG